MNSQFSLLLFLVLSFTIQISKPQSDRTLSLLSNEEHLIKLFQQWREKHQKVYKHRTDAKRGFQNFLDNMKFVAERNSKKGHRVGLNRFADLSNEEFRGVFLSKFMKRHGVNKKLRNVHKLENCNAPLSLDWRTYGVVTGIKDQGDCGSCWAFSSTGAIEGVNAITSGTLLSLSEQELVDCDSNNDGCDGGLMDYAFEWVISNGGIDSESDYPYLGADSTCNYTKEENKLVSIDDYKDVYETDAALLCAVAEQPISVGIDGSALDFQLYTGGIYDGTCSDNPNDIDHAVLIVGYGSEGGEDYWIVKNSWGTEWGIQGYGYIRRNTSIANGVCGINTMASYPTKNFSSTPSPFPSPAIPPPPPTVNPPPPPPNPSPTPSECGDFSYCPAMETCCCLFEVGEVCLLYGCCEYENGICCEGTAYCCPNDYPVCDVLEGLCLKNAGDGFGVAARKKKLAKYKLPWTKMDQTELPSILKEELISSD